MRFAARLLMKQPGFAVAVIISLGLGIGANTAIFSLLNALLLQPLPVKAPGQLVHIGSRGGNGVTMPVPGPVLDDLRSDQLLNGVCGFTAGDAIVEIEGSRSPLATHSLTGDCYQTLGVKPALGRLFTRADDIPNGPRVTVLGYAFWQEKFGGSPHVLGRWIRIGGAPFQIIGVTEQRFGGLLWGYPPSVSAPISQRSEPSGKDPSGRFYWADTVARLKPGVNLSQVEADLEVKWRRLLDAALPSTFQGANRKELLAMPPTVASAATGVDDYFRERFARPLMALLALSVLVLLAACVNVANLLLARGAQRRAELAIRVAIGATRGRIVRQLLAESAVLLMGGVGVAVLVSHAAVRLVTSMFLSAYGRHDLSFEVHVDGRVLLFAALLAILAVSIAALVPTWQVSDVSGATAMKSTSRSVAGGAARSRRVLLIGQVAFTLLILVGAVAFTRSAGYLEQNAIHFGGEQVLNAQLIPLPGRNVSGAQAEAYLGSLLQRVRAVPGVRAVSVTSFAPLVSSPYKEDIRRMGEQRAVLQAPAEFASKDFLPIMRIPLMSGREFSDADKVGTPRVAILSASVARRLFPSANPIGQHIQFGSEPETRDVLVIGVAADAHLEDPRMRDEGFVLLAIGQLPRMGNWGNLQIQFSGIAAASAMEAVSKQVSGAGRQQVFLIRTMAELRAMALIQERLVAIAGQAYSALALLLVAVGLFGLLSFSVSSRASEIAIRMALGARRFDIGLLVVREALWLVSAGIVLGLPIAYAAAGAVSNMLYGISAVSTGWVALAVAMMATCAAAAVAGPAYRATAVDPNQALK